MAEQPLPPGGHRRADRVPGEQPLVKRGHELRCRDRVHAVGHRHHRRRPAVQQPGGHRGLQLLADRAGLARVQHHHRDPRRRQQLRHPGRRHRIPGPVGELEDQYPFRCRVLVHPRCPGGGHRARCQRGETR
jgi:hypothetical protein